MSGNPKSGHKRFFMTDFQRKLLLERYDGRHETIEALMVHFPGIPGWRVKHWASELGLARRKEPRWSQAELTYLETHLHHTPYREIARHLGRTQVSIRLKAKRLGLSKGYEGYTMRAMELGLGADHKKIMSWIQRGWLRAERRGTDRSDAQGGDMWYFSEAAVRNFILAHPDVLDPRRFDWLWIADLICGGQNGIGPLVQPDREVG